MKTLNENVTIMSVELNNWKFDIDGDIVPISYETVITFYGKVFIIYFTTRDLQQAENWGLSNSGCEGDSILFDSANTYFENNDNDAKKLLEMMEEEWNSNWRDNSPFNYMGIIEEQNL